MPVTRELILDFLRVRQLGDPEKLAAYLDEDVDWLVSGPVDVLPHCGQRRGRAAVIDIVCRVVPGAFNMREFEVEHLLVHGDYAATLSRFHGVHAASGRHISYRCAHFMRFRENKLIWYRGVIDSFNATEQVMGHELDFVHAPDLIAIVERGDLVEI
jgi:ketosteroid isomerase-like protein